MPSDDLEAARARAQIGSLDLIGQLPKVEINPQDLAYYKTHITWAYTLCTNPANIPIFIPYRDLPQATTENSLMRDLLRPAIKHHDVLWTPPPSPTPPPQQESSPLSFGSILAIYDIADKANGWEHTAHGGLIAALFDELCGQCIGSELDCFAFTIEMKIGYKKRLRTPVAVLGRGRVERVEARKIWVKAELVDGETGMVYADCETVWVKARVGEAKL